ncbi:MAG: 50S ribosomal protein L24 [Rickettsiales bacterium]|jgi:large subunit ribosomal protein L24|nr:50S ribosomal protein L24 [Rickettsiales bacterium]
MAAKIRKNDRVVVIAGRDKGKIGDVLLVIPRENRVLVSGVNVVKRHKKPTTESPGQVLSFEKPIHMSNVSLVDNGKAGRVGFQIEDGKKFRVFKRSKRRVDE